jgi:hypothetical protein
MELDRTEIIIRKRGTLELLDLSLLVVKRHFGKLFAAAAILGLPMMLMNLALLGWLVSEETTLAAENSFAPESRVWWRYFWHLIALTTMQFPIVSIPVTLFLGAQIFFLPTSLKDILKNLWSLSGQIILILGVFRLGFLGIVVELMIRRDFNFGFLEGSFLLAAFPISLLIRAFWPFAPEIISLERCRLFKNQTNEISYSKRRSGLHGPLQGDLMLRMLGAIVISILLLLMTVGTALFGKAIFGGSWDWNLFFSLAVLPCCLWLVGVFLAVFRYLSYIDSRIRLEGWEIDLRLRAEAHRLAESEHHSISTGTAIPSGVNS